MICCYVLLLAVTIAQREFVSEHGISSQHVNKLTEKEELK